MKLGITCQAGTGGSGILATELGLALAARGHEIHFVTLEQPFRLTGFREKALTVPIQSLVVREDEQRQESEGVYVVEDGKVAFRPLKTGLLGELAVEILDGVKEGETIVTGPFRELRTLEPGDAVREAPPEGDAPRG